MISIGQQCEVKQNKCGIPFRLWHLLSETVIKTLLTNTHIHTDRYIYTHRHPTSNCMFVQKNVSSCELLFHQCKQLRTCDWIKIKREPCIERSGKTKPLHLAQDNTDINIDANVFVLTWTTAPSKYYAVFSTRPPESSIHQKHNSTPSKLHATNLPILPVFIWIKNVNGDELNVNCIGLCLAPRRTRSSLWTAKPVNHVEGIDCLGAQQLPRKICAQFEYSSIICGSFIG